MSWVEQKYIGIIAPRLSMFSRKSDGVWNMRCPLCGDSRKSKSKARGFILQKGDRYTYVCHNCNQSLPFTRFLEIVDPTAHKDYIREAFVERYTNEHNNTQRIVEPAPDIGKFIQPKFIKYTALNALRKVSQLAPEHPVKKYVMSRRIPSKFHSRLFLTTRFKEWTNTLKPDKFNLENGDEPRLIIPFVDRRGNLFGYQGRAFGDREPRYITIILDEDIPRVFGAELLDFQQHVYVTEGPIDSMFLHNCLAMGGSHMDGAVHSLGLKPENMTIVYDNEPRNSEIVKQIDRAIDKGYNVCIWPSSVLEKDVNDMVRAGRTPAQVQEIVDKHTYRDLTAKIMLTQWKRV